MLAQDSQMFALWPLLKFWRLSFHGFQKAKLLSCINIYQVPTKYIHQAQCSVSRRGASSGLQRTKRTEVSPVPKSALRKQSSCIRNNTRRQAINNDWKQMSEKRDKVWEKNNKTKHWAVNTEIWISSPVNNLFEKPGKETLLSLTFFSNKNHGCFYLFIYLFIFIFGLFAFSTATP